MEATSDALATNGKVKFSRVRDFAAQIPLLSWLLGLLVAVALEYFIGTSFARALGLRKAPMLFGFVIMLKKPALIHSAVIYLFLIYLLPITVIARLSAAGNRVSRQLAALLDQLARMANWLRHQGRGDLAMCDRGVLEPAFVRLADDTQVVAELTEDFLKELHLP